MPRDDRRRQVKKRAKRIHKIAVESKKDTAKDYLQYTLVVLVIIVIIGGAVYITQR